jgi:hypothetical protein
MAFLRAWAQAQVRSLGSDKTHCRKLSNKEFQSWLKSFLKEDGALLDELAHR